MKPIKFTVSVFYTENPETYELDYNYMPGGARVECMPMDNGKLPVFDDPEELTDRFLLSGPVVRGKLWSGENMGAVVYIAASSLRPELLS